MGQEHRVLCEELLSVLILRTLWKKCAHRCSENILARVSGTWHQKSCRPLLGRESHIFLLRAVISREALITRSRRSWCSSSSARNVENMEVKGEAGFEAAIGREVRAVI